MGPATTVGTFPKETGTSGTANTYIWGGGDVLQLQECSKY